MKARPLPRGPQDAAPPLDDEVSVRRRALELAAIRDGANDLARRADAAGLPLLGYLLACAALEAENGSGAGQGGKGAFGRRAHASLIGTLSMCPAWARRVPRLCPPYGD